jgi:hypothetical protein
MKIIELSAVYTMNFRIYCELVPIADYKKQQRKYIYSEGKGNIFNFLNKCLNDYLLLQPIIIRIIYLCIRKTFTP